MANQRLLGNKAFDVVVNVRVDAPSGDFTKKEEFVYSILFRDNKNVATSVVSPATSKVQRKNDVATDTSVSPNSEKSTPNARKLLKNRVSGDELLDAQDLIDEVKGLGGQVDRRAQERDRKRDLDGVQQALAPAGRVYKLGFIVELFVFGDYSSVAYGATFPHKGRLPKPLTFNSRR